MPTAGGPNTLGESNLVFAIDTHDTSNGITPLGCGGFNGSTQGVKNLITGTIYPFTNGMKLTGRSYFTSFAIDYPEYAYGGDAANRHGITPGYDVRSGGKLYDASRALHLWVYNNDTNSWIDNGATTYFRGARLGGHSYDNFTGAENGYLNEINLFISDYNTLKSTFPNSTFVVMGSHRADQYTAALRVILYDLGMPTGYIDSDYIPAPEWILVGEPGLGTGNAFGWVYENYTTNGAQVAHLNFGLPIKARGGIEFDGTNDYLEFPAITLSGDFSISQVVTLQSTTNGPMPIGGGFYANGSTYLGYVWFRGGANEIRLAVDGEQTVIFSVNSSLWTNKTTAYTIQRLGSTATLYINGAEVATGTISLNNFNIRTIGYSYSLSYTSLGTIDSTFIYNRALSAGEIKHNYQQYKTRFNLS